SVLHRIRQALRERPPEYVLPDEETGEECAQDCVQRGQLRQFAKKHGDDEHEGKGEGSPRQTRLGQTVTDPREDLQPDDGRPDEEQDDSERYETQLTHVHRTSLGEPEDEREDDERKRI